jgi:hypothetical protein
MDRVLRACDVAIAPLLVCAGQSNKIVDASVLGDLPVIASPAAQAGLPAPVREQLIVALHPREWAEQIELLWTTPSLRAQRARRLADAIRAHLNDEVVLARLNDVMEQTLQS